MRTMLSAFAAGLLSGAGLIVSGMADPANVLGFFDVAGEWDPSLAFVMAGGVGVTMLGYGMAGGVGVTMLGYGMAGKRASLPNPASTALDGRLIGGAVLFGLGWGLAGYCPGPALVAAGGGFAEALLFAAAMVTGMLAWKLVTWRLATCPIWNRKQILNR